MNELPEHHVNIERKLWTDDVAFYNDNLTEDCLLVFPETGVISRDLAALASSLYIKRDGMWKLTFHQQTPLSS